MAHERWRVERKMKGRGGLEKGGPLTLEARCPRSFSSYNGIALDTIDTNARTRRSIPVVGQTHISECCDEAMLVSFLTAGSRRHK
jgi:hypothetical protein